MAGFFEFKLPPESVNEFRIHGVGGTPPENLLNHPHPEQVSGDSLAGFYRHPGGEGGRNLEAYSWGGLTSRNAFRSLWLLLLPFTLVNVAGWMVEADPSPTDRTKRQWHAEVQERLLRLVALLVTISFVTWAAAISVDLVGHQCGRQPICREGHWWLDFLGKTHFQQHPASAMAVGLIPPVMLLLVLAGLAYRSRKNFEKYNPLGVTEEAGDAANLRHAAFWYRPSLVSELSWIHISAALFALVAQSAYSLALFEPGQASTRLRMVMWGSIAILVFLAGAAAFARTKREVVEMAHPWRRAVLRFLGGLALATLACLCYYAIWRQRAAGNVPQELVAFRRVPFLLLAMQGLLIFVIGASQFLWWWSKRKQPRERRGSEATAWALFLAVVFGALIVTGAVENMRPAFVWVLVFLALVAFAVNWHRRPSKFLAATAAAGIFAGALPATQGNWTTAALAVVVLSISWTLIAVDEAWQRDRFRWCGAATASLVAVFILTGTFAGAAKRVADFLDRDPNAQTLPGAAQYRHIELELPAAYDWFSVVFAASLVVTVVAGVLLYLHTLMNRVALPAVPATTPVPPAVALEGRNLKEAQSRILKSMAIAQTAKAGDLLLTFLAGMTAVALLTGVLQAVLNSGTTHWVDALLTAYSLDAMQWLLTPSSWLLAALPVLFVLAFRKGYSSEATRRKLGIVWDVASFWPRRFHPLAAPSYAERAVPELQQRIRDAIGQGAQPRSRVVVAAHSQGSVLAFAALATYPPEQAGSIALATYGSPLGSLYHRVFPTYFTIEDFKALATRMQPGQDATESRWKNFFRETDPIGGRVFTEPWPPSDPDPRDVYLCDPYWWCSWEGQPGPLPLGHSDYIYDPELSGWLKAVFPTQPESPDASSTRTTT